MTIAKFSSTAPGTPTAPRATPHRQHRIDLLGAGAVLIAAIGLIAVVLLLRPSAAPQVTSTPVGVFQPATSVYTHHPVDRHDDAAMQAPDDWALSSPSSIQVDVHHPVDRHEQP